MANRHLNIYLNDHLAGAVAAIQFLDYLEAIYAGTDVGRAVAELRRDISADRSELEELMRQLGTDQSAMRKTSAWLGEKLAQLKLFVEDPKGGSFRLFEATEALSLGILGKKSLWQTLSMLAQTSPELQLGEYDRLIQRAEQQHASTEKLRLGAARDCLVGSV